MIEFPQIDPVAISLGPLDIRWYALAYLAGFILGWKYALYLVDLDLNQKFFKASLSKADIDDFLSWSILGVIVGGRLGYVLFYQTEMIWLNPLEVLAIWQGGMSFHGGVLGVLVSIVAFAKYRQISILELADIFACAAPIGLFFGRIANFINGELFGRITDVSWGVIFPHGGDLPRHPSQLYEASLEGLLLLIVLSILAHRPEVRNKRGLLSGVFLVVYGFFRIFIEFFREPDFHLGYIIGSVTLGQILCAPMIIGGAILIFYALSPCAKINNSTSL